MAGLGVRRGDVIGLMLANRPEFFVLIPPPSISARLVLGLQHIRPRAVFWKFLNASRLAWPLRQVLVALVVAASVPMNSWA
jgi:hypothetical protein